MSKCDSPPRRDQNRGPIEWTAPASGRSVSHLHGPARNQRDPPAGAEKVESRGQLACVREPHGRRMVTLLLKEVLPMADDDVSRPQRSKQQRWVIRELLEVARADDRDVDLVTMLPNYVEKKVSNPATKVATPQNIKFDQNSNTNHTEEFVELELRPIPGLTNFTCVLSSNASSSESEYAFATPASIGE